MAITSPYNNRNISDEGYKTCGIVGLFHIEEVCNYFIVFGNRNGFKVTLRNQLSVVVKFRAVHMPLFSFSPTFTLTGAASKRFNEIFHDINDLVLVDQGRHDLLNAAIGSPYQHASGGWQ